MPGHRTATEPDSAGRFSPTQVGRLVGVTAATAVDWCAKGLLPGAVQLPGGRWRIPGGAFAHLLPVAEQNTHSTTAA